MTLSELVKLKLELDELAHTEIGRIDYREFIWKIVPIMNDPINDDFSDYLEDVKFMVHSQLEKLNNDLLMHFTQVLGNINHYIKEESKKYLTKEYVDCATSFEDDRDNRKLPMSEQTKDILLGRIQLLSDWHYPGLEISPHDGEFTKHLVASDPLYLVDVYPEYIDLVKSQYSREYQARLRPYIIKIGNNEPYLDALPKNQFGTAFCWNTFNYLPLSVVTQYIKEVFDLLRPGGTFLFGYNNANSVNGAKHVEWGGMAYMTNDMLISIVEELGYKTMYSFNKDEGWHNISWLEIQKPGKLETSKAHQVIGAIKYQ